MSLCTMNIIDGTVPSAMAVKEKLIWGISVKSVGWEQLECRVGGADNKNAVCCSLQCVQFPYKRASSKRKYGQ